MKIYISMFVALVVFSGCRAHIKIDNSIAQEPTVIEKQVIVEVVKEVPFDNKELGGKTPSEIMAIINGKNIQIDNLKRRLEEVSKYDCRKVCGKYCSHRGIPYTPMEEFCKEK